MQDLANLAIGEVRVARCSTGAGDSLDSPNGIACVRGLFGYGLVGQCDHGQNRSERHVHWKDRVVDLAGTDTAPLGIRVRKHADLRSSRANATHRECGLLWGSSVP